MIISWYTHIYASAIIQNPWCDIDRGAPPRAADPLGVAQPGKVSNQSWPINCQSIITIYNKQSSLNRPASTPALKRGILNARKCSRNPGFAPPVARRARGQRMRVRIRALAFRGLGGIFCWGAAARWPCIWPLRHWGLPMPYVWWQALGRLPSNRLSFPVQTSASGPDLHGLQLQNRKIPQYTLGRLELELAIDITRPMVNTAKKGMRLTRPRRIYQPDVIPAKGRAKGSVDSRGYAHKDSLF